MLGGLQDWGALAALGLGALVGAIMLLFLPRTQAPVARHLTRRRDLQAELTHALENLRELEERGSKLVGNDHQEERTSLEARAGQALAALKAHGRMPADVLPKERKQASTSAPIRFMAARPRLQGALWGVSVAGLGLFLYVTVDKGSVAVAPPPRGPFEAQGGAGMPPAPAIDREELDDLKDRLMENPNNTVALVRLAHLALQAQELEQAQVLTDRALAIDATDVEARVHRAVVQAGTGDAEAGHAELEAVLQHNPGFAEAWFFRGMLSMQAGDLEKMQQSFTQFVRCAPDGPQKERIRAMLARSRTD